MGGAAAGPGDPPSAPPPGGGASGEAVEEAVAGLQARLSGLEGAVQELQRARPEAGAGARAAREVGPEGGGGGGGGGGGRPAGPGRTRANLSSGA